MRPVSADSGMWIIATYRSPREDLAPGEMLLCVVVCLVIQPALLQLVGLVRVTKDPSEESRDAL